MSRIGIIGGTGQVGGLTAAQLAGARADITVIARRAPEYLPEGAVYRPGDLEQPSSLREALAGIDNVFLITPVVEHETRLGVDALGVMAELGVDKVVYMAIAHLEAMQEIPHFANKIPIVARLREGPFRHVVLAPNFFMQNDFMGVQGILQAGVYPLPVGEKGLNSIDVRDIADAAVIALTGDRLDGQEVPLCGPDLLTGPTMAATWAGVLGRPVAYAGDDLEAFTGLVAQGFPDAGEWLIHDLRTMMDVNQRIGCIATEAEHRACAAALGRPPRRYADFVREAAASFR